MLNSVHMGALLYRSLSYCSSHTRRHASPTLAIIFVYIYVIFMKQSKSAEVMRATSCGLRLAVPGTSTALGIL